MLRWMKCFILKKRKLNQRRVPLFIAVFAADFLAELASAAESISSLLKVSLQKMPPMTKEMPQKRKVAAQAQSQRVRVPFTRNMDETKMLKRPLPVVVLRKRKFSLINLKSQKDMKIKNPATLNTFKIRNSDP